MQGCLETQWPRDAVASGMRAAVLRCLCGLACAAVGAASGTVVAPQGYDRLELQLDYPLSTPDREATRWRAPRVSCAVNDAQVLQAAARVRALLHFARGQLSTALEISPERLHLGGITTGHAGGCTVPRCPLRLDP